jgi:hypothetical protein
MTQATITLTEKYYFEATTNNGFKVSFYVNDSNGSPVKVGDQGSIRIYMRDYIYFAHTNRPELSDSKDYKVKRDINVSL